MLVREPTDLQWLCGDAATDAVLQRRARHTCLCSATRHAMPGWAGQDVIGLLPGRRVHVLRLRAVNELLGSGHGNQVCVLRGTTCIAGSERAREPVLELRHGLLRRPRVPKKRRSSVNGTHATLQLRWHPVPCCAEHCETLAECWLPQERCELCGSRADNRRASSEVREDGLRWPTGRGWPQGRHQPLRQIPVVDVEELAATSQDHEDCCPLGRTAAACRRSHPLAQRKEACELPTSHDP